MFLERHLAGCRQTPPVPSIHEVSWQRPWFSCLGSVILSLRSLQGEPSFPSCFSSLFWGELLPSKTHLHEITHPLFMYGSTKPNLLLKNSYRLAPFRKKKTLGGNEWKHMNRAWLCRRDCGAAERSNPTEKENQFSLMILNVSLTLGYLFTWGFRFISWICQIIWKGFSAFDICSKNLLYPYFNSHAKQWNACVKAGHWSFFLVYSLIQSTGN